jgi:hypothetical protein
MLSEVKIPVLSLQRTEGQERGTLFVAFLDRGALPLSLRFCRDRAGKLNSSPCFLFPERSHEYFPITDVR